MNIRHILHYSYHEARNALVMGTSEQSLARARERAFVKALSSQLGSALAADDIRVFSTYGRGNLADFGGEHLLYDIDICRIALAAAPDREEQQFPHIAEALWQIAIEFARDWQPILYAANRLCCGGASSKLLVTAQPGPRGGSDKVYRADTTDQARAFTAVGGLKKKYGREEVLAAMLPVASACPGDFQLAWIPHPLDWDEDEHPLDVWRCAEEAWQEL